MTLESILADHGPLTAQELSRRLQRPIEEVYQRLTQLEGLKMAEVKINYYYVGTWARNERVWNIRN